MGQYSIKDLEKVTGIKAHTIRIWEKRYGIVEPSRSDTNIRSYTDDDLKKLLNISMLNRHGIKISKLAVMSQDEIKGKILNLSQQDGDTDTKIESLLLAMIELNEDRFNEGLNLAIQTLGFKDAFVKVVKPVLNRSGDLWLAGTINPAHEHFVSNLIRQKIIAEIDRMSKKEHPRQKRFLLFLPEGEMHEMGLLFFSYLLRYYGHEFIYFGQNTPLDSVAEAARHWHPDYVMLSLVNSMAIKKIDIFLQSLINSFPGKEILVSGYQTQHLDQAKHPGLVFIRDANSFEEFILSL